jgi:hypothetical protein
VGIVVAVWIGAGFSQQAPPAVPPANIFTSYGVRPDYVRVTRGNSGRIRVGLRLHFSHGQTCSLNREGDWRGDHVSIAAEGIEPSRPCELKLSFPGGRVLLADEGQRCAQVFCGTRGKLDGVRLPRRRP